MWLHRSVESFIFFIMLLNPDWLAGRQERRAAMFRWVIEQIVRYYLAMASHFFRSRISPWTFWSYLVLHISTRTIPDTATLSVAISSHIRNTLYEQQSDGASRNQTMVPWLSFNAPRATCVECFFVRITFVYFSLWACNAFPHEGNLIFYSA